MLFALFALNAGAQVVLRFIGRSDDPRMLTLLQAMIAVSGAAAALGSWTGRRWAPAAALLYGVLTSVMLISLVPLLELEPRARGGLWSGAAGVLLGSVGAAWYLRRTTPRQHRHFDTELRSRTGSS